MLRETIFKKLTTQTLAEVLTNSILNLNVQGGPPSYEENRTDPTAVLLGLQDPFKQRWYKGFVLAGADTMAKLMQQEGYVAVDEGEKATLDSIQYADIESFMGVMWAHQQITLAPVLVVLQGMNHRAFIVRGTQRCLSSLCAMITANIYIPWLFSYTGWDFTQDVNFDGINDKQIYYFNPYMLFVSTTLFIFDSTDLFVHNHFWLKRVIPAHKRAVQAYGMISSSVLFENLFGFTNMLQGFMLMMMNMNTRTILGTTSTTTGQEVGAAGGGGDETA